MGYTFAGTHKFPNGSNLSRCIVSANRVCSSHIKHILSGQFHHQHLIMKRASSASAHLTTDDAVELNFEWWLNSAELKAAPLAAPKSTPCMHGRVRVCRQTNESPAHVLLRWKFFRKLITTALCREQQIKLCRTRRERSRAAKRAINRPAALCYYCRSAFANLFPLYCRALDRSGMAHKKTSTPIAYLHYF